MSQFPHDEFFKEYIPELIQAYGKASSGEDVSAQRREIDVFFQPIQPVPTTPDTLGLLGELAQKTCLLEAFRNPVSEHQITECLGKLFDIQTAIRRQNRRNQEQLSPREIPFLWILTPTLSRDKLNLFKAETKPNWSPGIYFLPPGLNTAIVVIHQLPLNRATLWLRILGRGKIQERAIDELKALPKNHPHRDNVLELIGNLFAVLEAKQKQGEKLKQEDQELIMKLSPIYAEKLAESKQIGLQQGIQQGLQQEANLLIMRLLKRKIGELPPNLETKITSLPLETLEDLGEALLDFDSLNDLNNWLGSN